MKTFLPTVRAAMGAALILFAPAAGMAAQASLSGPELRKLFPGRFTAVVRGFQVQFIAHRDGRLVGRFGSLSDSGRWQVRGARLCIMLKDWLDGRNTCAPVRRAGGWYRARDIRFRKL